MKAQTLIVKSLYMLPVLLLASCASTKFTGTWVDPAYKGDPIKSIMIVGVAENQRNRNIFESTVSQEFEKIGVKAVPSAQVLGKEKVEKDTVIAGAEKSNVDWVLVTRLKSVDEEQVYYPPTTYAVPDPYYYRWDTYYPRMYDYVDSPGYMATYKNVHLETNIYRLGDKKLIWSAASETFDPQDVNKVVKELADKIIRRLKQDKLLKS